MFINPKETIDIVLFYKKNPKNNVIVITHDIENIPEEQRDKYTKIIFKTRPINFKMHNDIQRASMVDRLDGEGERLDWFKYKENKLLKILVDWDAKDENGNKVLVTEENILSLHPIIAEALLSQYDKKTILGEEE